MNNENSSDENLDNLSPRQQVLKMQDKLFENLRVMNKIKNSKSNLTLNELMQWYYQHVLVYTIQKFTLNESMIIPKYISTYKDCFKTNKQFMNIYDKLILVNDVNHKILNPVFDSLLLALKTQDLQYNLMSTSTAWKISPKK